MAIQAQDFIGYHGTDSSKYPSIKANNFRLSPSGKESWYGPGAYFFVEGATCCPITDARIWAKRWSDEGKNYSRYGVVRAQITCASIWDLRTSEGLKRFNQARFTYLAHMGTARPKNKRFDDAIIAKVCTSGAYDSVIANAFTQYVDPVPVHTRSNIPNSTILCVFNPSDSISLDGIELEDEGLTTP